MNMLSKELVVQELVRTKHARSTLSAQGITITNDCKHVQRDYRARLLHKGDTYSAKLACTTDKKSTQSYVPHKSAHKARTK